MTKRQSLLALALLLMAAAMVVLLRRSAADHFLDASFIGNTTRSGGVHPPVSRQAGRSAGVSSSEPHVQKVADPEERLVFNGIEPGALSETARLIAGTPETNTVFAITDTNPSPTKVFGMRAEAP